MIILGLLKRLQTEPKHHPSNEVQSQQQHLAIAATQKQHVVPQHEWLCVNHICQKHTRDLWSCLYNSSTGGLLSAICLVGREGGGGSACLSSIWHLFKRGKEGQQCFQLFLPTFPQSGKETARQRCTRALALSARTWRQGTQQESEAEVSPSGRHKPQHQPQRHQITLPLNEAITIKISSEVFNYTLECTIP